MVTPTGKTVGPLPKEAKTATRAYDESTLAISADGRNVALAVDRHVTFYGLDGDTLRPRRALDMAEPVRSLALAPHADRAVVQLGDSEKTRLFVVATSGTSAPPHPLTLPNRPEYKLRRTRVPVMSDAMVAVGIGHLVLVFDHEGSAPKWEVESPSEEAIPSPAFSPDGKTVYVLAQEGLDSWDASTGRAVARFGGASKIRGVRSVAFAGEDRLLSVSSEKLTVWSLAEARRSSSYPLLEKGASHVEMMPGGVAIVHQMDKSCLFMEQWRGLEPLTKEVGRAKLTKIGDGAEPMAWPPAPPAILGVCAPSGAELVGFSLPRGRFVYQSKTGLGVFDAATGKATELEDSDWTVEKSYRAPTTATMSPDGRFVVSVLRGEVKGNTFDVRVGRWDASTGKRDALIDDTRSASEIDPQIAKGTLGHGHFLGVTSSGDAAVLDDDYLSVLYDLPTGRKQALVASSGEGSFISLGRSRSTAFVGKRNGSMTLIEGTTMRPMASDSGRIMQTTESPSGKVAVSTNEVGGIVVWDVAKAQQRATLFDFDDDEWAVVTPNGAYDGTAEVADRVGWVFDAPMEAFRFEQFSASFHDPARVLARLSKGGDDLAATVSRPPQISITSAPTAAIATPTAKVKVHVSASTRVDVVRAFVEARPVAERAVCAASGDVELEIPVVAGINRLEVVAFDHLGFASNGAQADLESSRSTSAPHDAWVLAVGVNQYPAYPRSMWLGVADADARGIAEAFRKMEGTTYAKVHTDVLTDSAATPTSVRAALSKLSAMAPEDVAIVFFAGHGYKPSATEDMRFLTGGVRPGPNGAPTRESLASDAIGWDELSRALAQAKGRVLVLLDACHSGHVSQELVVPNDQLANSLVHDKRAGAIVFAAAKGRQVSLEPGNSRGLSLAKSDQKLVGFDEKQPHGFFTGAFLEAIVDPRTDKNLDGTVQLSELMEEVMSRVRVASKGQQTPWVARRDLFGDFGISVLPK